MKTIRHPLRADACARARMTAAGAPAVGRGTAVALGPMIGAVTAKSAAAWVLLAATPSALSLTAQ